MPNAIEKLRKLGSLAEWSKYQISVKFPLADQARLLEELRLTPNDIRRQDIVWVYKDRLFLVVIEGVLAGEQVKFRLYPSDKDGLYYATFTILTKIQPLYTSTIELMLDRLSDWLDAYFDELEHVYQNSKTYRITVKDLGAEWQSYIPPANW